MYMRKRKDLWDTLGKAVAAVLVVLLSLYIAIPVVRQVTGRYETEPVTYITVTESGNTSGVIVRAEKLLSTDKPYVSLLAENGEEVAASSAVAVAVQNQSSLDVAHRANEVEAEINYLRGLLSRLSTASDNAEQESAVRTAVYRLAEASMQEDAGELDSSTATLSTLLRGGAAENSEQELTSLLDELTDLRSQLGEKDYLYAPAAGIFSAETDGFEALTPAVLDGISPEGVENLRTQGSEVPDDVVGKIVTA